MAKGISVHAGLNSVDPSHYGGWSGDLGACEYDAEDLQEVAKSQGFSSTLLLTAQATRDAVIGAIKNAADELASGDIFFLTYSGHGGQDNQLSGDGIANGVFTGRLLRVWSNGLYQGDYASFHKDIVEGMPPTQSPNHFVFGADNPDFAGQKPFTV